MPDELLKRLRKENALPFVDFALADHILKPYTNSHASLPLILHLSQSVRAGHLCIKIDSQGILPKPRETWEINAHYSLSDNDWKELDELICNAAIDYPSSLVTDVSQDQTSQTPICRFHNLFYFQKYWFYESNCLKKLTQLLNERPTLHINENILNKNLNSLLSQNNLLPEQAFAISQLEKQTLTIISGGPGTGKTYTAGLIIQMFWQALSPSQQEKCRIALTAPTGKATANLQKSLAKQIENIPHFKPVIASTIHSLLGLSPNRIYQPKMLSIDLLVIDECSMIDIRLMSLVLNSLKSGVRLILLGDPFQLPPVEVGSIFSGMIKICPPKHIVELKNCHRTELKEIVSLSHEIKKGCHENAWELFNSSRTALQFSLLDEKQNLSNFRKQLWEKVKSHFLTYSADNREQVLNQFRLLTPLRKGPFGVDALNAFLYKQVLIHSRQSQLIAVPIIITTNAPSRQLFNGDVGLIIQQIPRKVENYIQEGDYALFGDKKIPVSLLPRYEYAYCLSVHKSQGSEFDRVLLLLPEGGEVFGRELVYTAVTRARKHLEIWSTPLLFKQALFTSIQRLSRLTNKCN